MGRAMNLPTDVLILLTIQFLIIPDSVTAQQEERERKPSISGFIALGCVAGFLLLLLALSTICYLVRRSRQAKYREFRQNKLETKNLVSAQKKSLLNDDLFRPSTTDLSNFTRPARKDTSYPAEVKREFDEFLKPYENEAQRSSLHHSSPLLDYRRHSAYHPSQAESDPYIHHLDERFDLQTGLSFSKNYKDKFRFSQKNVLNEKHYTFGIATADRSFEQTNFDPPNQYSYRRSRDSIDSEYQSDSTSERYKSPSRTVVNMLYTKNPKLRNQPRSAGSFGSSIYHVGSVPQPYNLYSQNNYYLPGRPRVVPARPPAAMSTHQSQLHPQQGYQLVFVKPSPPVMRPANMGRFYVANSRHSEPVYSVRDANAKLSSYRPKVLQTVAPGEAYVPTPLAVVGQPPQNITTKPTAMNAPLGGPQFRMVNESQASPREKVISSVSFPGKNGGKSSRNKPRNRENRYIYVNDQVMQPQSNNPGPHNATHIWREVPVKGGNNADSRNSNGHEYSAVTDFVEFGDEHAETGYTISNTHQTGTKKPGSWKLNLRRNPKTEDEVVIIDYVSTTGAERPPVTVSSDDRYSGLCDTIYKHNSESNLDREFDAGSRRQRTPDHDSFEMLPRERYLK